MAESKPKVNNNVHTLPSGKKIKLKSITLDLRDELVDQVEFKMENGSVTNVTALQKTITHWMRNLIDGDVSDKALMKYTWEERTEFFKVVQKDLFLGED